MNQKAMIDLKRAFREWCGLLSIDEIISNVALAEAIAQVEQLLNGRFEA
jgi:hypothetical protein